VLTAPALSRSQHGPPQDADRATRIWRALRLAVALSLGQGVLLIVAGLEFSETGQFTVAAVTMSNVAILITFAAVCVRSTVRSGERQRAAERRTEATHVRLQELIDNTSAVIYMKRIDDGRYILVNREWERLFKVARDEVVNLTDHEVFPVELADQLRANDLRVAEDGEAVHFDETTDTDDGPLTYISVKFPVFDNGGQPYAVCGISTDITERKRAEQEIRELNEKLETRVRQRTAELEASTHELDAFAYSVSHDLRAPLRSLHGFSQALLEDYGDVLDEAGKDYLGRLQRNVRRMGQLIDDLLTLSRATRADLTRRPVDLSQLAREVTAELRAADPARDVVVEIAGGLPAEGDSRLLRLVLTNLLGNAWKFTAKTPGARISVGQVRRDGERAFFVSDNGAGFDMRYAGKLFTAFQRLHSMADFEGTGIGLATVQRVVHRHGGRISAEAEPGKGATFYFTLDAVTGARQEKLGQPDGFLLGGPAGGSGEGSLRGRRARAGPRQVAVGALVT
jgi:PAS domain S-box-containing protein